MLKALHVGGGWANHSAVRMWRGYEDALSVYYNTILGEWIDRGYRNSMPFLAVGRLFEFQMPFWFGDEAFHASHRSNLLRKDPKFYGQYKWKEPNDLPYVWPVPKG